MLAFSIGFILALIGALLLSIINLLGIFLKINKIPSLPLRYFCRLLLLVIQTIAIMIGIWLTLDLLTHYFNIDLDKLNSFKLVIGAVIGLTLSFFLFSFFITKKESNS